MKNQLSEKIETAVKDAMERGELARADIPEIELETPKFEKQGDFSTNIAMKLASLCKRPPRDIAQRIQKGMDAPGGIIEKIEIAGPGFINFFMSPEAWHGVLRDIHEKDAAHGACDMGRGEKVQVEFVSANPTGPLHVGHGRGAALGDTLARILSFCGYEVQREYYINDSGRQIRTLGQSVFLRYRELFGQTADFPEDCYQGAYVRDLALQVKDIHQDKLLELDEKESIGICASFSADAILEGIRNDLERFGVTFDRWFSEKSLFDSERVFSLLNDLKKTGAVYEKDGALWFKTSDYGDEKDRVVIKKDGLTTYFASDIAYHHDKFSRGFHRVIDVWGADHHGYIPRMKAATEAVDKAGERFDVVLVRLVNLLRNQKPVAMSTRAGEFVTLKDVVDEVGADAARFIFLTRRHESPLDFDIDLAKKKTNENPVHYVQYVHARISSVAEKARNIGLSGGAPDPGALAALNAPEDLALIKAMSRYPETVRESAALMEPHRIAFFLTDLAGLFHSYYNRRRILTDDPGPSSARLYMALALKKVIRNGLGLLGVSAPEKM
ncbi:Arginine--tRNA ligase [Candidatus Desulfarcum epimagneticum]|uniref:Arginine--tRNA ligase n=1 Tax=uncultured Desulfobacteraceae bacterium TaxID=218296 RepID=A0A484HIT8_9BACT|nr:Arginine--tRNA ligase [uncultured Desulfobacteraceae bacterium]